MGATANGARVEEVERGCCGFRAAHGFSRSLIVWTLRSVGRVTVDEHNGKVGKREERDKDHRDDIRFLSRITLKQKLCCNHEKERRGK